MARIRTIKPEFFTSSDIVSLSAFARLLYIALWCEADRDGRFKWKPADFKLRYLPNDKVNIDALCLELVERHLVIRYGDGLAFIPSFSTHQHVNPRESASKYPEPDASLTRADASPRVCCPSNLDLPTQGGREGKGKEGKTDTSVSGSRLPDDWDPSAEDRVFAEHLGLNADTIAASFKDYWRGIPGAKGRKADWPGTWRNWCRKDAESQRNRKQTPNVTGNALPTSEPWEQRVRGYKPGGFWKPNDWGPPPEDPGCRVPAPILAAWRQQGAQA